MKRYLEFYYKRYPQSKIQDFVKLVAQITFGPGYEDINPALNLKQLKDEILNLKTYNNENLYEYIGYDYVRVNLRVYNLYNLSINYLNESILNTYNLFLDNKNDINRNLAILKDFLIDKTFSTDEIQNFINKYIEAGFPNIDHSELYIENYNPAYKVIHHKYLTEEHHYYQMRHYLDKFDNNVLNFISLEGKSGSGKTTLTNLLLKEPDVTIISVDDFFDNANDLIGINSERIIREIFSQAVLNKQLKYNRYDCHKKEFQEVIIEKVKPIVIIEGVYSANPELRKYYKGKMFINISTEEQIKRLEKRSKGLLLKFINEWIPRENKYFEELNIFENADIIVG